MTAHIMDLYSFISWSHISWPRDLSAARRRALGNCRYDFFLGQAWIKGAPIEGKTNKNTATCNNSGKKTHLVLLDILPVIICPIYKLFCGQHGTRKTCSKSWTCTMSSSSDSLWSHKFSKPSIISASTQHWKIQHCDCASLTWWICWQNKALHLKYHSIIFSQKVEIPSLFPSRACIYSPSGFSSQQCCLFTKFNSEIHWFLSNWPLLWMTLSNSPSNFPWCWWWFINNLIILH